MKQTKFHGISDKKLLDIGWNKSNAIIKLTDARGDLSNCKGYKSDVEKSDCGIRGWSMNRIFSCDELPGILRIS
ncbi:MAG: hypothetical protein FIB07_09170 [Candidatus Methanoperedens sp.]|nr:hypothetical protein [Candidatus Methanoperedens sp.]